MRNIGILGAMLPVKDIYHAAPGLFDLLLSRFSQDSPLAAAEAIQAELFQGFRIGADAVTPFNTYPTISVTEEDTDHTGFLSLCTGMERLSDALENMLQWTERVDTLQLLKQEKCAVLLADKWDAAEFLVYFAPRHKAWLHRNSIPAIRIVCVHSTLRRDEMDIRTEFFNPEKRPFPFEGVIFSGRMEDKKLGAYCKSPVFCLIAGACDIAGNHRDVVALGRWDGEQYSAWNRVPSPFFIRPSPETVGKTSVVARNIVNRLCSVMSGPEEVVLRAYLTEKERLGIGYESG